MNPAYLENSWGKIRGSWWHTWMFLQAIINVPRAQSFLLSHFILDSFPQILQVVHVCTTCFLLPCWTSDEEDHSLGPGWAKHMFSLKIWPESLKIWPEGPGQESCQLSWEFLIIWGHGKSHEYIGCGEVTGELRSHEETEKGGCREAPGTGTALAVKVNFAISGRAQREGGGNRFLLQVLVLGWTGCCFNCCSWFFCAPLNPYKHPCYMSASCDYASVICNYSLIRMEIGLKVLWLSF